MQAANFNDPYPDPSQPDVPNQPPPKNDRWTNTLRRWGRNAANFLKKNTDTAIWYLAGLSLASLLSIALGAHRFTCLLGLVWMLLWMTATLVVMGLNRLIVQFDINWPERDPEREKTWSPSERAAMAALRYAKKNPFAAGGLAIAAGHVVLVVHIHAVAGLLDTFFHFTGRSWVSLAFTLGAVVVGYGTDWLSRQAQKEARGGLIYLLAFLQYYLSFVVLVTGLIGGAAALFSVYQIVRMPWLLITHDMIETGYEFSYARTVLEGIGGWWFAFFYLLFPAGIAGMAHQRLRAAREGVRTLLPRLALKALRAVSGLVGLIGLFVAWNEGWVRRFFEGIIYIIAYIIHLIASLF